MWPMFLLVPGAADLFFNSEGAFELNESPHILNGFMTHV